MNIPNSTTLEDVIYPLVALLLCSFIAYSIVDKIETKEHAPLAMAAYLKKHSNDGPRLGVFHLGQRLNDDDIDFVADYFDTKVIDDDFNDGNVYQVPLNIVNFNDIPVDENQLYSFALMADRNMNIVHVVYAYFYNEKALCLTGFNQLISQVSDSLNLTFHDGIMEGVNYFSEYLPDFRQVILDERYVMTIGNQCNDRDNRAVIIRLNYTKEEFTKQIMLPRLSSDIFSQSLYLSND